AIFALVLLAAFRFAPSATLFALQVALATLFLASLGLRLLAALLVSGARDSNKDDADATLTVYTVIAALYREAASVDGLLSSIERLDYPAEKLDVILVLEADDKETHERIAARTNRLPVTVITAPASAPRTKPKALNMALPFARGSFSVIYDAEDRPEADQLRRALRKFREGGERVACVQARLCIDNTAYSWLARFF